MTASRDPDRLIRAFLLEGEEELQDQVYDAVRAEIEQKPQRAIVGPWRTPIMNKIVGFGLAAAAVVAAVLVGAQLLGSPSGETGGPDGEPTPTPELTAMPEPSVGPPSPTTEAALPAGPFTLPGGDGLRSTTVTIPASGWSFVPEYGALAKGDEVDNLPEATMLFPSWEAGTGFYVYGDPCRWQSTEPETPATTVDEIVTALAAQASRDASEPVDVTVGGYGGKAITLYVPDDLNFDDCDAREFGSFGVAPGELDRYHQGPGQVDELWIVDVDGVIVIIDAMYRPDTPTELVEEMRSIAESATFELP